MLRVFLACWSVSDDDEAAAAEKDEEDEDEAGDESLRSRLLPVSVVPVVVVLPGITRAHPLATMSCAARSTSLAHLASASVMRVVLPDMFCCRSRCSTAIHSGDDDDDDARGREVDEEGVDAAVSDGVADDAREEKEEEEVEVEVGVAGGRVTSDREGGGFGLAGVANEPNSPPRLAAAPDVNGDGRLDGAADAVTEELEEEVDDDDAQAEDAPLPDDENDAVAVMPSPPTLLAPPAWPTNSEMPSETEPLRFKKDVHDGAESEPGELREKKWSKLGRLPLLSGTAEAPPPPVVLVPVLVLLGCPNMLSMEARLPPRVRPAARPASRR